MIEGRETGRYTSGERRGDIVVLCAADVIHDGGLLRYDAGGGRGRGIGTLLLGKRNCGPPLILEDLGLLGTGEGGRASIVTFFLWNESCGTIKSRIFTKKFTT